MFAIVEYTKEFCVEGYTVNDYVYINAKTKEEAIRMYEEQFNVKVTEIKER